MLFNPILDKRHLELHPLLQKLVRAMFDHGLKFYLLDCARNKLDQEKAFAAGHSRAHWGDSPHDYRPALSFDAAPYPLVWNNTNSFIAMARIIVPLAATIGVPIDWGGNWHSIKDYPHYQLSNWRSYITGGKVS